MPKINAGFCAAFSRRHFAGAICLFSLISATFAASIGNAASTTEKREIVPLLKYERENYPDGSFRFSYEGGDQTFREESAQVVDAGTEDEALEVSGSYRYIDQDGNTVEVHYTAGKNGFVPVGTHILSEISAAAKAAADLPQVNEEENKRKGRSDEKDIPKEKDQKVVKQEAEKSKVEEQKNKSTKVEEKQVKEPKQVEKIEKEEAKTEKADQIPVTVVQDGEAVEAKSA